VNDHLYEMTGGGISRTAAVVGENGFMLIDAMQDGPSLKDTIANLEHMTGKPLRYIVVTHGDLDHVDGIRHVAPEVTVIAHENIIEVMKFQDSGEPSDWATDPGLANLFPDIVFSDRMRIDLGGRIAELYWFGVGHTPSDIFVHLPEDRIVFIGDEAGVGGAQIIHAVKGGNSFGHVRVLEKLLDTIDADTYYFGHYPPGGRDVLQTRIDDMNARHAKVRTLIDEGKSRSEIVESFSRREQRLAGIIFDEISEGRIK
jgi:glyoxylase-like metal-dependent hydrolase (beta-lactamase superfamily II)